MARAQKSTAGRRGTKAAMGTVRKAASKVASRVRNVGMGKTSPSGTMSRTTRGKKASVSALRGRRTGVGSRIGSRARAA